MQARNNFLLLLLRRAVEDEFQTMLTYAFIYTEITVTNMGQI